MKFSIIIPMYNAEKYIAESLQSLIVQTYQDFEVIVVNDGSTDNSEKIVHKYLDKLQIKYINQSNSGQLMSRRAGVRVAIGEYLLFLDSDDLLKNDALELINHTIEKYKKVSLVMFGAIKFNEKVQINYLPPLIHVDEDIEISDRLFLLNKVIDTKELNNLCFKCIKKSIYENVIDTKPIDANVEEDLIEFVKMLKYIDTAVYLNKRIYLYRQNMESISHGFNEKHFESIRNVSTEIEKEFKDFSIYKFKERIANRFFKALYGSIIQLEYKSCHKNKTEKLKYLEKIANDEYYRSIYAYRREIKEKHIRFILDLLYYRLYTLCLLMAKFKCLISKKNQS